MIFEDFSSAHAFILWTVFGIAFVMGAVVNKTNFCTMGAVSDLVNMGDTGRMRAWIFAMAVAIIGVVIIESTGIASVNSSIPPYRGSNFAWLEYILGGIMFGIGMTLGSGCGNKTLVRIGGGNIKSILVFIVIAIIAPAPGEALFHVGRVLQVNVVQYQGLAIARQHHILFDVIGAHCMGQCFGFQGVLREIATGATVGDDNRVSQGGSRQHHQQGSKHIATAHGRARQAGFRAGRPPSLPARTISPSACRECRSWHRPRGSYPPGS